MITLHQVGYSGPKGTPGTMASFPETADDVPACFRQWLPPAQLDRATQMYYHASQFLSFKDVFRRVVADLSKKASS